MATHHIKHPRIQDHQQMAAALNRMARAIYMQAGNEMSDEQKRAASHLEDLAAIHERALAVRGSKARFFVRC